MIKKHDRDPNPWGADFPPKDKAILHPDEAGANPAEQAAAASEETEIHQLRQQVEQLKLESAGNYDRYVRQCAEQENFKKRLQREKADAVRFASEPLLRDLLPIVDNLKRALEHAGTEAASVVEGVKLVLKALLDVLERHGVKRIEALGQPFDPAVHEAIAQVESVEQPTNHVVTQHHTGYQLHDRLLRPTMVTVSRGPGPAKDAPTVATAPDSD